MLQYFDHLPQYRDSRYMYKDEIDGLMQERRNSIANALELCLISPEGYELWHPHNWPVTTTNNLPPHLANYLGHQRVSVFV